MKLGDRMKEYEGHETERRFMSGLPVYSRIDGRSFSKFTRSLNKPFDERFMRAMQETAKTLVEETQALLGYVQSDEISLCWQAVLPGSQIFFDGKVQKMSSVLASIAGVAFYKALSREVPLEELMPVFDCRVFSLPSQEECANCFLWREIDATKNAISMAAYSKFSHKSLDGKDSNAKQEMLFQSGINFNDYPTHVKRGSYFRRVSVERELSADELAQIPERHRPTGPVVRHQIERVEMPFFSTVSNRTGVIFRGERPQTEERLVLPGNDLVIAAENNLIR